MLYKEKHYKKATKFLNLYLENMYKHKFKAFIYKCIFDIYSYKVYKCLKGGQLWQKLQENQDGTKKN